MEELTLALVILTGVYAFLTLVMAVATCTASSAAKKSAAAAVATAPLEFTIRPVYRYPTDSKNEYEAPKDDSAVFNLGIKIENRGARVFIHGVRLEMFYRMIKPSAALRAAKGEELKQDALWDGTKKGPRLMHQNETWNFWSPDRWVPLKYLAGVTAVVKYSFAEKDTAVEYAVAWWGAEEEDFEHKGTDDVLGKAETYGQIDRWTTRTPGVGATGVQWKPLTVDDFIAFVEEPSV